MRLSDFPRPPRDNGRGLHFQFDLRRDAIAWGVERLREIRATWTTIAAGDEAQARRAAHSCWDAGIMPIVRPLAPIDGAPVAWEAYVAALGDLGFDPYVQVYNEPSDNREWRNPSRTSLERFGAAWARGAARVYDAGGLPGLQVSRPDEFSAAVAAVREMGRTEIWSRAWFALHNGGANHPPAYPYDERNQLDHPGVTILDDDVGVLKLLAYADWMINGAPQGDARGGGGGEGIGFVLPMIGTEGGWRWGERADARYGTLSPTLHAAYHVEMFEWFRTGRLSNGLPVPPYLMALSGWILNDGASARASWNSWWGGALGDKRLTIHAIAALPAFTRWVA